MIRLEYILDTWKTVRKDTAQAVRECASDTLDAALVEGVGSFREIATHILQAGFGITGLLLEGKDNLAPPVFREGIQRHQWPLPRPATQEELALALDESITLRARELASQDSSFYSGIINRFDGQAATRLETLLMVKEHEMTHRSQLFMLLRQKGIVPATTRRRLAAQAAAHAASSNTSNQR